MTKRKVFISAPSNNELQQMGVDAIQKAVIAAGFEVIWLEMDENVKIEDRLAAVDSCDLFLGWVDGLLPKGVQIRAVGGMQQEVAMNFPPQIQQVVDAGWKALGGAQSLQQKKAILLPGEVPDMDSPKGFSMQLGQNTVLTTILSPPINLPDGNILVEFGYALAKDIPVLVIAGGPAAAGDYIQPGAVAMVGDLEDALTAALKTIADAPGIRRGVAQILHENKEDLEKMAAELKEELEKNGSQALAQPQGDAQG